MPPALGTPEYTQYLLQKGRGLGMDFSQSFPSKYSLDDFHTPPPAGPRTLQAPPQVGGSAQMQPDTGTQVMDLLKKFQQMGTRPFAEQQFNAQDAQVQRTQQTPDNLIGASPSLQSSVRGAAVDALNPIVSSAKNSQQTFNEQLTSAKDFLKEYSTQQEKAQDNARTVINNILTTTDPSSLKDLNQEELNQLERVAGYPKGFLASAVTYKQKQLDNTKTITYQDLGDRIVGLDTQGNIVKTLPKGLNPKDASETSSKGGTELKTNALNSAKQLLTYLNSGVGTSAVGGDLINRLGPVSDYLSKGTSRADFLTTLDNLKSLLSLDNVKYLKGQGQVSDAERRLLEAASSKLNRNLSEGEFKSVLQNVIAGLSGSGSDNTGTTIRVRQKATGQTGSIPANEFDPNVYDKL